MQGVDIAVAHQRLGMATDQLEVDLVQQAHAAVTAAHTQDSVDVRGAERIVQVAQTLLVATGEVTVRLQYPRVNAALLATAFEPLTCLVGIQPRRPGRGDDGKTGIVRQGLGQQVLSSFQAPSRHSLQLVA